MLCPAAQQALDVLSGASALAEIHCAHHTVHRQLSVEQRSVQDGNLPCQAMMAPAAALDKPMMRSPPLTPNLSTTAEPAWFMDHLFMDDE
jgi:hypothetical protein